MQITNLRQANLKRHYTIAARYKKTRIKSLSTADIAFQKRYNFYSYKARAVSTMKLKDNGFHVIQRASNTEMIYNKWNNLLH